MNKILELVFSKLLLNIPIINRHQRVYELLGVRCLGRCIHICHPCVVGSYKNLYLHDRAEINKGCFLLAKDKIEIGNNSTLAYGVTILTSANPNGPYNKLSKLYPAITAPVLIGNDVWVGANAIILPGVTIGNYSVIGAGSVVTKDVPEGVLAAGNPAVIKKKLYTS